MNHRVYILMLLVMLEYRVTEGSNCTTSCADVPDFCFNYGTCYQDMTTCQYGCYCSSSFSGQRCEQVTGAVPTTTLRPKSERQCIPGFECVHGYCNTDAGTFSCVCDVGWKGIFCDSFQCPLNCPNNADCVMVNGVFECKDKVITAIPTFPTESSTTSRSATTSLSTTTLRPILERQCIPGFECVHGYCNTDAGAFSCVCDVGWKGIFCDSFHCPLNCPNNADCFMSNGVFECKDKVTTAIPSLSTESSTTSRLTTTSLPTTTLRPISERQCIPGFECVHGYCDKDGATFSCVCDLGWIGIFCDNFQCPMNCPKTGECVLFNDGYKCKEKTTTTSQPPAIISTMESNSTSKVSRSPTTNDLPITTLRPLAERQCVPGFECIHGYCNKAGAAFYCTCDEGWEGAFCHSVICPLNCPSNSDCIMVNDTFKCKTKYTTTKPSSSPRDTPSTTPASTDNSTTVHVCSANYTKRPLSERQCMPNFVCEYGVCEMSAGEIGTILECVCDDGGLGGLCQDICCMPCSEFGQCKTLANGTEYCQCQFNYEGKLCDMKKKPSTPAPSSTEVELWPLWVSAIVLVCLIVAAVLLFFWMWRNRVTIVMKIVHYFQAYEDDDEKTWDAFVSYKSADIDQKFVIQTLFPKLEKELGFTLCLHHRDFLPGETIANNIINAIDNSRRTILILTSRYVSSEFTRFEYQVAQHEMLKRKHKIIPILLEDIGDVNDSMDPNLKQIIKSVTYLAYPGSDSTEKKINHFWKKLTLSMPKKRATEERQKQQKENIDEKEKKTGDDIDRYYDDVEEKHGKNGIGNPAFVTDVVLTVEDEQKIHDNEKELIENLKGINIIEWTHL